MEESITEAFNQALDRLRLIPRRLIKILDLEFFSLGGI